MSNSLLRVLEDAPGFAKISLQGPQGSGKSRTAVEIAVFLWTYFKSKKPIAFFDTESGSDYLAAYIKNCTGLDPLRIKTRAFSQLLAVTQECIDGASDILITDSITHVWREIQASYMKRINEGLRYAKTRMDIQDIMRIKEEWAPWPDLFLNSPLHVLVCGREGNEWGHEENEETGKRDLVAVGKKMKVEGEFGYEASLMISMHAEQIEPMTIRNKSKHTTTKRPRTIINVATVLKDRFDELNGCRFEMPTGKDFLPFIKKLAPASHGAVNTELHTTETLPEMDGGYMRVKTDREILVEKIQAQLLRAYPGQTGAEKKARNDAFDQFFATRSWTEIEKRVSLSGLRDGLDRLKEFVDRLLATPKAEDQLERISELSTELLEVGVSSGEIMGLYEAGAGVQTVKNIQPGDYAQVIQKLEAELATRTAPKKQQTKKVTNIADRVAS